MSDAASQKVTVLQLSVPTVRAAKAALERDHPWVKDWRTMSIGDCRSCAVEAAREIHGDEGAEALQAYLDATFLLGENE